MVILLLPLVALTWHATYSMRQFYLDKTAADLEARARLVEKLVFPLLKGQNLKGIDGLLKSIGPSTQTRITVILPSGQVVGDSETDPARMDNHSDRPEIQEALNSTSGSSKRHSDTLQKRMMYVAVPVMERGRTICVIRTATPISYIDDELSGLKLKIVFAGLLFAGIAAMISYSISRRLSLPLEQLKEGAKRFGEGNLGRRLPASDLEEINELVDTMNTMAVQLDDRIQSVVRQRNELKALLSSMVEGVVAVDMERRIVNLNQAAADLLDIDRLESIGQFLQETVRNIHLHTIVEEVLTGKEPVEQEILVFQKTSECFLRIYGTLLKDTQGSAVGALMVLHDVTHLRKLENIRREFVANVSHELKTPVTSIKASVETLLEGALNDALKMQSGFLKSFFAGPISFMPSLKIFSACLESNEMPKEWRFN